MWQKFLDGYLFYGLKTQILNGKDMKANSKKFRLFGQSNRSVSPQFQSNDRDTSPLSARKHYTKL